MICLSHFHYLVLQFPVGSCMDYARDYALMHPGSLSIYAGNSYNHEAGSVGSLLCFKRGPVLIFLLRWPFSLQSFLLFLPKIRGGGGPSLDPPLLVVLIFSLSTFRFLKQKSPLPCPLWINLNLVCFTFYLDLTCYCTSVLVK